MVQEGNKKSIATDMTKASSELAARNTNALKLLMECRRFCILMGLAMRGHRDDGSPCDDDDDGCINMGNFKSLVQFRAMSGDNVLQSHIASRKDDSSYGRYMSNTAQIDMLAVILAGIQKNIIQEAKCQTGRFIYALSADEVSDVSNTEQLAIIVRTVASGGHIHERLLST